MTDEHDKQESTPQDVKHDTSPGRAVLYYDGDCAFCRKQVERLKWIAGDRIEARTFQSQALASPVPEEMKLGMPDGRRYGGAEAAFRIVALRPMLRPLLWLYLVPGIRQLANAGYRWIAANRYRFVSGSCKTGSCGLHGGGGATDGDDEPGLAARTNRRTYRRSAKIFLFFFCLLYFVSFASLYEQVLPLNGSKGLIPAQESLRFFERQAPASAPDEAFWRHPTVFWHRASDEYLRSGCIVGMVLALLATAGIWRRTCLVLMGVLYLSYLNVGGQFYYFQWDLLQIETTLHALLLPSFSIPLIFHARRRFATRFRPPNAIVVFLMQWLLFRLYFESGLAKILAAGGGWRDLTAMDSYYNTAPLATWLGWYFHNAPGWWMPTWWHQGETVLTLIIELLLPIFIFSRRSVRTILFFVFTAFQALIVLTGNYGLFNYMTLLLGLFLLDDGHYEGLVRLGQRCWGWVRRRRRDVPVDAEQMYVPSVVRWLGESALLSLFAAGIVTASLVEMSSLFLDRSVRMDMSMWIARTRLERTSDSRSDVSEWDRLLADYLDFYQRSQMVNRYHLFASMTRERLVPQIEGLDDQGHWRTYEYRYAPSDPKRPPPILAPYHPRLDFQVWFVGLSRPEAVRARHPYFVRLLQRLQEDPHCAAEYFTSDPFPDSTPRKLRVMNYRYEMSDPQTKAKTGAWWVRTPAGRMLPEVYVPSQEPSGQATPAGKRRGRR